MENFLALIGNIIYLAKVSIWGALMLGVGVELTGTFDEVTAGAKKGLTPLSEISLQLSTAPVSSWFRPLPSEELGSAMHGLPPVISPSR
ncbi:MAG: hypothetical protein OXB88_02250 [Bacteriovoracales bacterium]|nr:hypothetical protein [Bacteriovoracales bacterium]